MDGLGPIDIASLVLRCSRRAQPEPHAKGSQPVFQGKFLYPVYITLEELVERLAGQRLHFILYSAFRDAPAGFPVPLPQLPHQVIQTIPVLAEQADQAVQSERHQRALVVITDNGILCTFILLVELGPGVETRLRDRLSPATGIAVITGQRGCQHVEIVGLRTRPRYGAGQARRNRK